MPRTKQVDTNPNPHVVNAFDLMDLPAPSPLPPFIAVTGTDRFLNHLVVRHLASWASGTTFVRCDGNRDWRDVADELSTVSLFSTGHRHVMIDDADNFVTANRKQLETFVKRPPRDATLLIIVSNFPATTNLFKLTAAKGIVVQARPAELQNRRSASIDTRRMFQWLGNRASNQHGIQLTDDAAKLLVELVEWNIGRLDQELAKLALFVESKQSVDVHLVTEVVGGWRTETTWEMLAAVAQGDAANGLKQLDRLLQAGDNPNAIFGSTSWSLRRFAVAARLHGRESQKSRSPDLGSILRQAGFFRDANTAGPQLKQVGRQRATQLFRWLLDTDLALKGSHSSVDRSRLALELLYLRLSREARPQPSR